MQTAEIRTRFADRVIALRDARKLTQEELAARSGISVRSISNIENAVFSATIDTVQKLADGLQVEPRELFEFHRLQ